MYLPVSFNISMNKDRRTVRGSSFFTPKEFNMPVGYYDAETLDFDIVLYIDGKSHGQQLSTSKPGEKIPNKAKKREKEQKFHYQHLASPRPVDEDIDENDVDENVKREFDRRKLRVIVLDSTFEKRVICKENTYPSIPEIPS